MHMTHRQLNVSMMMLIGWIAAGYAPGAHAQATSANDDFTQANDTNSWKTFDGACLTAGDGTGSIPACIGLKYYGSQVQIGGNSGYLGQSTAPSSSTSQAADPPGKGALRFTNWFQQAGSIISNGPGFPTGAGLQVIFKTVTYAGDSGGTGHDGADGIGFFLMDGALPPYDTGAFGGSLGYTCTNEIGNNDATLRADGTVRGYDGLVGGYIGLGIDEYGNFLNPADNTVTGPGLQAGRIGLRGRGSISFGWLHANYPSQYPTRLLTTPDATSVTKARAAVHDTCRTGHIWDYSDASEPVQLSATVADYAPVGSAVTLSTILQDPTKTIAKEGAFTRNDAQPITYNLKITQDGILSLAISYNGGNYLPVIAKQSITTSNGALPSSFRFGFTGSTGGSRNVHEILCFQAAPADVAGTSVGVNQQEATKISSGTQAYLAYYYPSNWTGRLTANDLTFDPVSQTIGVSAKSNWDALCNLTGVPAGQTCPTTTAAGLIAAQAPTSRTMLTWDPSLSKGIPFEWTSLGSAQQTALDLGDTTPFNSNRLNYLRGDRTNEVNPITGAGLFRTRDGVLSDIVDSSPTWVGPPSAKYAITWHDRLIPADPTPENTGTQNYSQFLIAAQTRLNVVYNGANDGFVHGFESGSFDAGGNYVNGGTTPNDGKEVLAFMPATVLNVIHNKVDPTLDLASTQYSHNFYVDATPDVDDVFYNNIWHTWLVGGLGPGGAAIYALDITDPTRFSESNAGSLVMGEWSSATISCHSGGSACQINMGNTYGTPIVRRLHDGKWAIIFGNGFGSVSGDAGIFIMLIDPNNGGTQSSNTYYLSTGNGTGTLTTPCTTNCDGIAYVTSADLDGDHITDYVYAGDLLGNVWRFDLTSSSESAWAATSTPLMTTAAGQPITTKVTAISVPQPSGPPRIMIDFGTGRKFPQTNAVPTQYSPGVQALYGIWDWNLSGWNSMSSTQYASLPSPQTMSLTSQTLTVNADNSLDVTSNAVCWAGSTTCTGGAGANKKFGFAVSLPHAQEQIVFNPLIFQSALIVNTTIPAVSSPTSCQVLHDTGDTIALSLVTGGSLGSSGSGSSGSGSGGSGSGSGGSGSGSSNSGTGSFFRNSTDTKDAGSLTNGTGTPFVAQAGGITFLITQSLGDAGVAPGSGAGTVTVPPGGGAISGPYTFGCSTGNPATCGTGLNLTGLPSKRLTWIERR
jgi:type IV pilus assembly protein PilY1